MSEMKYTTEGGATVEQTEDVEANREKANAGFTYAAMHHGEMMPLMQYTVDIKGILPARADNEMVSKIMDDVHETVAEALRERVVEVLERWGSAEAQDTAANMEVEARAFWAENPVKGEGGMN